jgi:hypothetical protein
LLWWQYRLGKTLKGLNLMSESKTLVPISDRLRQAADLLEELGENAAYVGIRPNGSVYLTDGDFLKLFWNKRIEGVRDFTMPSFFKVRAEQGGLLFETTLHQLFIGNFKDFVEVFENAVA